MTKSCNTCGQSAIMGYSLNGGTVSTGKCGDCWADWARKWTEGTAFSGLPNR